MELHGSGLIDGVTTPGHGQEEMNSVIDNLFHTLRNLVTEHETLCALEHRLPLTAAASSSMDELLTRAQVACSREVFPEAMTALCLLRRKVRAAHLDLNHRISAFCGKKK